MANHFFTMQGFAFLEQLARNNNRDWFNEHKSEYENLIRTPALNFIDEVVHDLAFISPHFLAIAKKPGGSLMRVHRDVRFGRDKRPYKTNIGIQFRHEQGRDVHAPGFYLHIEPGECFVGVGIWRPDADALGKIRDAIVERGIFWSAAINDKNFKKHFELSGESLKNAPRGYEKDHPLIKDLKRKDFIAISSMDVTDILGRDVKQKVMKKFTDATPYMQFLCQALSLRY